MQYQNIGSMFFSFVTKQMDERTEYNPQDHASIAASRGKD